VSTPPISRNPTEDAILEAAREALLDEGFDKLTMETIAKRAFVSRTAVYFYFSNKRAVVDRLIQTAFADMYQAAAVYLEGDGDPRVELHVALAQTVEVVNREQDVLLLAAGLTGRGDQLPAEWASYILRFVNGAAARIARDQAAGLAPGDMPPRVCAQALLSMVERHVVRELIVGRGNADESIRVVAELWWRAVYGLAARPPQ
jgi:TetR/AcrR family transcriptional regulator, ethionamide resistance regulator